MSAGLREWHSACKEMAQTRAREESLKLWEIPASATVPFDYRWEHVKEVVAMALHLCDLLGGDREVVEAAAWLHDIRKLEKNHAQVGADEAALFLRTTNFPRGKIDAVVDAIAKHEGFTRPAGSPSLEPVEAAILWDADKLTKLGAGAVLFSFASPYVKGEDIATRFAFANSFVRDVLVRTVTSMNSAAAHSIAEARYAHTIALLEMWEQELTMTGLQPSLPIP